MRLSRYHPHARLLFDGREKIAGGGRLRSPAGDRRAAVLPGFSGAIRFRFSEVVNSRRKPR